MAVVTKTIQNLMNGVSQQPISVRLSNQSAEQINSTCRVSDGLSKRLAVEMIKADRYLDGLDPVTLSDPNVRMHMLRGVDSLGFTRTIQLLVDGVTGLITYHYVESNSGGQIGPFPYLEGASKDSLKCLTDGDTTYILNKNVTVMKTGSFGDDPDTAMRRQGSMGWVKNGYFGTTYTLKFRVADVVTNADVLATQTFTYTTNSSSATTNLTELQTSSIANAVTTGLGTQLAAYVANVANTYANTHLEVERADNWWKLSFKSASSEPIDARIEMTCTSSTAETAIFAANGVTKDPINLPKTGSVGYVCKIDGDPTEVGDHYYLKYDAEALGWVEAVKLTLDEEIITDSTLPLRVTGLLDGAPVGGHMTINGREVGDDETSPDPSFVGFPLNDIFIFNNRLGFLSRNNVIMSRIDEFDTFYRTTVATSLAADRVDLKAAIPSAKYTELNASVPFETSIMLFGDFAQYVINTTTGFDITKTSLQTSTEYEASKLCSPINLGASVYFPVTRGNYSGIFDLSRKDGIGLTAEEATSHIPTYIKGQVIESTYSTVENIVFMRTLEEKRTIYVQNRFVRQTILEQNAWHKWTVPNDILFINVLGPRLYICMVAEDGLTLIRTSVDISTTAITPTDSTTIDFTPQLDYMKLMLAGSTALTVDDIGADYYIPPEIEDDLVAVNDKGFQYHGLVDINAALVDEDLWVGIPYTFEYTFSEQVPAEETDAGKMAYKYGKLTLQSMRISYVNTGKFDIVVTPTGRASFTQKFTGMILGAPLSILGRINLASGDFKFSVNCRSNEVTVKIVSSHPYPCTFNTLEWRGVFTNNAGRM